MPLLPLMLRYYDTCYTHPLRYVYFLLADADVLLLYVTGR